MDCTLDDEVAALALLGRKLPACRLIVEPTGSTLAEASRRYDALVRDRGLTEDPTAVAIRAANVAELQPPGDA